MRDLVRAREQIRVDLMRSRHRLSKLLLRHGIRFDDGRAWTDRHRAWLATITLPWPAAQMTLLDCQGAIDALCHRRDALEREILALLPASPWAMQAGRLRCLRGVDTLTAVGLCAEIGDFERFAKAEQLMNYIGLVPCENTTGQQRRLGSITKTGSGHARRHAHCLQILVNAVQVWKRPLHDRLDRPPPHRQARCRRRRAGAESRRPGHARARQLAGPLRTQPPATTSRPTPPPTRGQQR